MKRAMMLLGNGYEETEALTVIDYLRRADIPVDMVSITGDLQTVGDHQIQIKADKLMENINADDYDAVLTPGGLPGATMLAENEGVTALLKSFYQDDKLVASLCASPIALEAAGISANIKGTCFPGFEDRVQFKEFSEALVVKDGNVITSRGPATSAYFALAVIEALAGKEKADDVKERTLVSLVEEAQKG